MYANVVQLSPCPLSSPGVHVISSSNSLPAGWRKVITDGKVYYQNDITKQTQWDPPQSVAVVPHIVYLPASNQQQLHHMQQYHLQSNVAPITNVHHVPATSASTAITGNKNEKKIISEPNDVETSVSLKEEAAKPTTTVAVKVSLDESDSSKSIESISSSGEARVRLDLHKVDIHVAKYHSSPDSDTPPLAQPSVKSNTLQADTYNPEDNTGKTPKTLEDVVRPWWHKDHVILLFMFVLSIFDFITDIKVFHALLDMDTSLCPQFKCPVRAEWSSQKWVDNNYNKPAASSLPSEWLYLILLIGALIGFIFTLFRTLLEANKFLILYRMQVTNIDEVHVTLHKYSRELKWSWIPLLCEQVASMLIIIYYVLPEFYWNVGDSLTMYTSLTLSIICVFVALILLCIKRQKVYKSKQHQKHKTFRKALYIHCVWCTFMVIVILFASADLLLIVMNHESISPVVDIMVPQMARTNGNVTILMQCLFYETNVDMYDIIFDIDRNMDVFRGDIIDYPALIYDGCDGMDFTYDLQCTKDADEDTVLLHCELNWSFTDVDSDCHKYIGDDLCGFDLNPGICQNYNITDCDNFEFFDGNPVMWACFDYCLA